MPIYEYQCTNCNNHFDRLQKIDAAATLQCPQCLKDTAVRLVSAPSFQLKGNGWYVTDFKDKKEIKNKESAHAAEDKSTSNSKDTTATPTDSASSSDKTPAPADSTLKAQTNTSTPLPTKSVSGDSK